MICLLILSVSGLAGYVYGEDEAVLKKVARGLRAGNISVNGASAEMRGPFGGISCLYFFVVGSFSFERIQTKRKWKRDGQIWDG